MLNKNANKRGFTIVELLAVMTVISIGLVGVTNIITQIFSQSRFISSKLVAAYLAQEGIEIVRNIRDTNWLEGNFDSGTGGPTDWDYKIKGDGLGDNTYRVDYQTTINNINYTPNSVSDSSAQLKLGNFYDYSSPTSTSFYRLITAENITDDELKIKCEVQWTDAGRTYKVTVVEHLHNWR